MQTLTRALTGLALALLFSPDAPAQSRVLTPHDVARTRSVSSARMSPDGTRIAYTLSVPRTPLEDDDGPAWGELHVLDLATGVKRPFITGEQNVRGVHWTPSGTSLAFLAKRGADEHTSLYMIPTDGGEARRVFGLADAGISSFTLAPDGERVAVVATAPKSEALTKLEKQGFKAEIYEEDWRPAQVWIGELDEPEAEPRLLELEGSVYQAHWSPVDDRLAISIAPTALVDDSYMLQRAWIVDGASGEVLNRIETTGKFGSVVWSPDGTRVALIAAADVNDPTAARLMVCGADEAQPRALLPDYPGAVHSVGWKNGEELLFVASKGVWRVLEGLRLEADAEPQTIADVGGPILTGLSLSDDGLSAAFTASTPGHPSELYTMKHGDGGPRRLTDSNTWLADVKLAPQEVVTFKARDGLKLQGLLIRPLDEVAGQRYPLVMYVHGGPESHHSNGWLTGYSNPGQIAAARGMAVFHTNYRGSTGRGIEFAKLSQGDPAGAEFDDLVDAVDHLVGTGLVDTDRVAVTGGSYGGYATAWCSTRYSERFAAGVMFVGISDMISKVGTTDIPNEEFYVHALRRVWDDWQKSLERSPIYYAGESQTPLLILHGKSDPRVNPGQSRELYRHLKLRGKAPVRLVFYPGEGHGNRRSGARLDYNLRSLRWLEHYLTGAGGEMPAFEVEYEEPETTGA